MISFRNARLLAGPAEVVHVIAIAALVSLLAYNHFQIITAPVPLDYYEGTMPLITGVIASGHDPYTFEFQPVYTDQYPPLYNLIVAPLTLVYENSLQLHRAVSAAFIAGCCVLLGFCGRRAGACVADCVAAGALLYAALLFYSSPIASTNATGTFLFLASILLPWLGYFGWRSLLASLVCGLLAFYTKQYFVVSIAIVPAYLYIAVSRKRAIAYMAIAGALLTASLIAIFLRSPYFLDNTVISMVNAVETMQRRSGNVMLEQLGVFSILYLGLFALIAIACVRAYRHYIGEPQSKPGSLLQFRSLAMQLLTAPNSYPWFCFAISTVVIMVSLGHHRGNYMTYLFQLMTPFLLLGTFALQTLRGKQRALLLPLIWITFVQAYLMLPRDFSADLRHWQRVEEIVSENEDILASKLVLNVLLEQEKRIFQGGHTLYFQFAANKPALLEPDDPERSVMSIWNNYLRDLYQRVREQRFDAVILSDWDMYMLFGQNPPPGIESGGIEYFKRYYECPETVLLQMTDRLGGGNHLMQICYPRVSVEMPLTN